MFWPTSVCCAIPPRGCWSWLVYYKWTTSRVSRVHLQSTLVSHKTGTHRGVVGPLPFWICPQNVHVSPLQAGKGDHKFPLVSGWPLPCPVCEVRFEVVRVRLDMAPHRLLPVEYTSEMQWFIYPILIFSKCKEVTCEIQWNTHLKCNDFT